MKKLYHGAAFYPELWNIETVKNDIDVMVQTGINIVRIGEFIWSKLEPVENQINISFLKDTLDLLYSKGIDVIMCTPTATPPIWVTYGHEERLHMNSKGEKMIHGSRQHACTNNVHFREQGKKIIQAICKEIANHPAIVLWQIDNELKCHISECFCETCRDEWHKWLKNRYKTIDVLNEKWGTMVWSQLYQDFEQVPQPFERTPFIHNSSITTMYRTFHREKIAEFATEQAELIRKFSNKPITTNGGLGFTIDNQLLFENLDEAGFDTYASHRTPHSFTLICDIWRNIKPNKNFWLLETSASHTGALDRHAEVHPKGYLLAEAIASYALGSNSFIYWLWRQQAYGCEINHSAVISAWGKPGVGYGDVLEVSKAKVLIEEFMVNSTVAHPELAITYSDRARTFMLTESHKKNDYRGLMNDLYKNVLDTGVHRDLILESNELDGYKILMTPFIQYISDEYFYKAKSFVESGGIWIVGPLSGGRTEEHTINLDAALGRKLEELAGVEVEFTYHIENSDAYGEAFGILAPLKLWSSVFKLKDAKAIGVIKGGITNKKAFITEKTVGKGKVVMLGSLPYDKTGDELIKKLIKHYSIDAKINFKEDITEGTIAIPRYKDNELYKVVVNMDGQGGSIALKNDVYDIIEKCNIPAGKLQIEPYNYKIIKI